MPTLGHIFVVQRTDGAGSGAQTRDLIDLGLGVGYDEVTDHTVKLAPNESVDIGMSVVSAGKTLFVTCPSTFNITVTRGVQTLGPTPCKNYMIDGTTGIDGVTLENPETNAEVAPIEIRLVLGGDA